MILYFYILWNDHHNNLVNLHQHPVTICVCLTRNFKIYSLSNFQACNSIYSNLAINYIPRTYLFYKWKSVLFFYHLYPFCPLPNSTSSNRQSVLYIYEYIRFVFLVSTYKWAHMLSFSDLFYLAWDPQSPPMLLQMARFHFFSWLDNIPLNIHPAFSPSTHPSTDT